MDLTSLTSVRRFASNILRFEERLDVLISNAGAFKLGNRKTADKLDVGMQVNYFAPFLLIQILAGKWISIIFDQFYFQSVIITKSLAMPSSD